MKQIKTIYRR